jgi:hypothetical protein
MQGKGESPSGSMLLSVVHFDIKVPASLGSSSTAETPNAITTATATPQTSPSVPAPLPGSPTGTENVNQASGFPKQLPGSSLLSVPSGVAQLPNGLTITESGTIVVIQSSNTELIFSSSPKPFSTSPPLQTHITTKPSLSMNAVA